MSAKKRRRSRKSLDPGRVKLYADENVDPYLIDFLRDAKVNVQSAVKLGFSGRGDRFHFAEAKRRGRSLLTHDREYLDHSKFPFNQMRGVVILGAQPDHESMRWLVQWLIGDVVPSGKDIDGTNPPKPKHRKQIVEQLDVGQEGERASTAKAMQSAAENLKKAREAVFALTTADLIQATSMAKASGMTRAAGALEKAQQAGANYLDELQKIGALVDKANEVLKSENGGMGGDTVDQMQAAQNGEMNGAPVPAVPPVNGAPAPAPAPVPAAPAPAPAAESVNAAITALMETDIPERIANGEAHYDLSEAIRGYCPALGVRERAQVIDRIQAMLRIPTDVAHKVSFNAADHRLLSEVATFGSLTEGLADRTRGGRTTLASASELEEAALVLRTRGKAEHVMLAEVLTQALPGMSEV